MYEKNESWLYGVIDKQNKATIPFTVNIFQ